MVCKRKISRKDPLVTQAWGCLFIRIIFCGDIGIGEVDETRNHQNENNEFPHKSTLRFLQPCRSMACFVIIVSPDTAALFWNMWIVRKKIQGKGADTAIFLKKTDGNTCNQSLSMVE